MRRDDSDYLWADRALYLVALIAVAVIGLTF
jgi:hypothetical protein